MINTQTTTFDKILFPLDFSTASVTTVPFVKEMARVHGASITLAHIVPPPMSWYPPDGGVPAIAYDLRELLDLGHERLSDFKSKHFADLGQEPVTFCEEGDPALSIVDYAQRNGIRLIMMPTHGIGSFRRFLVGSVTAKVLHDATCAVWTGAHIEEIPIKAHPAAQNILCALDLETPSPSLLCAALHLAKTHGATLRIVHSVPGTDARPHKYFNAEFQQSLIINAHRALAQIQRDLKSNLEICIGVGSVAQVVRSAAMEQEADLVVIGRGVLNKTLGRLRTNAYAIIRESPCPVISF